MNETVILHSIPSVDIEFSVHFVNNLIFIFILLFVV